MAGGGNCSCTYSARDDAVVLFGQIGKHRLQPVHRRIRPREMLVDQIIIYNHRQRAPVAQAHAFEHGARIRQQLLQYAMHVPRIATAFGGLFSLDGVQLLQNLHGDDEVVILKLEDRLRIVKEDVGVQNESLTFALDSLSSCDFGTLARLRLSIGVDKICTTLHSISDLSNGILQTR
jgi:hypothetical protein